LIPSTALATLATATAGSTLAAESTAAGAALATTASLRHLWPRQFALGKDSKRVLVEFIDSITLQNVNTRSVGRNGAASAEAAATKATRPTLAAKSTRLTLSRLTLAKAALLPSGTSGRWILSVRRRHKSDGNRDRSRGQKAKAEFREGLFHSQTSTFRIRK
jgi:hypothetical protein